MTTHTTRQSDATPNATPEPAEDDGVATDELFNADSRLVFDVSIDLRRLAIGALAVVFLSVGYAFFEIACE